MPNPDSYEEPGQDTIPVERDDRPTRSAEAINANHLPAQPKTNWFVAGCLVAATVVALVALLQSN